MLSHALRYAEKNGRIELCVSLDVSKKIKFEVAHAIQKAEVSIKADINDNICKLLVDMLGGTLNSSINSDCATYWFCIESSCPVETDLIPCEYQPSENLIGMRPSFCSYKSDNIEEETALFVIDDNSTNRQALKYILKTSNAAIFEAVNGKDAVKMFIDYGCKYKYWVVFMDIDMPVMDGIEAARQLKGISHDQLKVHIKIYIITAYDTLQHRLICSQAGVEGFFTKPISYDKIKEILKLNHLDLRG
jgi:CheY-like chemotaxis protein